MGLSESLENAFATFVDLKILSDIDVRTKPQPQSPYFFMQVSLYIILQPTTLFHVKLLFGHIYTYNSLKISYYNCYDFNFKKVSLSIQQDTP